ncbi:thermonuclease family protein [Oryzobacter telluris]|uniref:thermonuclease family protein n=1 Tax=Oryzobacter telluris TaxID=3149179 RepID=UPI00370D70DD
MAAAPPGPRGAGRGLTFVVATVAAGIGLVVTMVWVLGLVGVLALGSGVGSVDGSATSASTAAPLVAGAPGPSATAPATPGASASPSASPSPSPAASPKPRPTAKPVVPSQAGLVPVVGVVDGDTIKVRVNGETERVRVIGIDTPELAQRECYAQQASSRMQSLVQSTKVRLVRDRTQDDRDRYGRLLRHVQLADGRQVAEVLIAGGFGEEYTYDRAYAGQADYRAAQAAARRAGKGIWSSGCRAPVKAAPVPASGPGRCVIKGNIASDGEKIYHLPGQQYYDVTKISESKGERWFCSESDARSAGWRKSLR